MNAPRPATPKPNVRAIAEAVRHVQIVETEAWNALDALSNRTIVDVVEVFEDEIKIRGDAFQGPINVHCTLSYGSGEEAFTLSETFPGRFEGHLSSKGPIVTRLSVDTSSFYA